MSAGSERLGLVELLDRDGAVVHRVPIKRWPVTIGRALDCDVLLDDPHAAALHATLDGSDGGGATLTVGPSVNGVRLDARRLGEHAQAPLASGSEWQIGRTRLRLRLAGETLAAELPLPVTPPVRGRTLAAGLVLLLLWMLGDRWLQSDPGDPLSGYLPVLIGVPVALGLWCFLWALGSKLFVRHFDFLAHLRHALMLLLLSLAIDTALPLTAFALSWEWLPRAGELLALAFACVLLWGHLGLILPSRRRALAVGFATMFVVGAGLKLALNLQRSDRWFSPLYLSTLGPPALRVATTVTPERFIQEAGRLRGPLEKRAHDPDAATWLPADDAE